MKAHGRLVCAAILMACAMAGSATLAQHSRPRDPLGFLRRALAEANAPALTAEQETQLNTLITNFREARPDEPDAALEAARTAFSNAILAGDLAAAQAQAAIIANRIAALNTARLQAEAQFDISALALLRGGGQLDPLIQRFGNDRVLGLVGSLAGRSFGGRSGHGPGPR